MSNEARPDIRSILPKLVFCGDFNIRSGWKLGPRKNGEFEIVFFPAGSRTKYEAAGSTRILGEPCYVFTSPEEEHAYEFDSDHPIRHLFAHFTSGFEHTLPVRGIPPVIPADRLPQVGQLLKHILHLAATTPKRWRERASAMLWTILEELSSFSPEEPGPLTLPETPPIQISKAVEYLEARLHETVSIRDMAALTGWTHEYFTRSFVRSMGVSPKQYLLRRRIERACQLLRYQSSSVKEIAFESGFQSEQYFCRAFAKLIGVSPSKYREQNLDPLLRQLNLAPPGDASAPYPLNRYFHSNPNSVINRLD